MYFQHASSIWRDFPELVAGALYADGVTGDVSVDSRVAEYAETARSRLATGSVAELPEIQAWRRTFSRMGLKPTQYRCASEALLRRFDKQGSLPSIHPVIDLCNAVSLAYAIPVAVFDVEQVAERLEVRYAAGAENYVAFSGEPEHPGAGEVAFVDADDRAHARRWTNRQSAHSAVREHTSKVLVVAEALHDSAGRDVGELVATLGEELRHNWSIDPVTATLSESSPRFDF